MADTIDLIKERAIEMAKFLDEKKAMDIKLLYVGSSTVIADYFLIVHTDSPTHLRAMADDLEQSVGLAHGIAPQGKEMSDTWSILDYGSIIVHLFLKDARAEYKLEKLWADAEIIEINYSEKENIQ